MSINPLEYPGTRLSRWSSVDSCCHHRASKPAVVSYGSRRDQSTRPRSSFATGSVMVEGTIRELGVVVAAPRAEGTAGFDPNWLTFDLLAHGHAVGWPGAAASAASPAGATPGVVNQAGSRLGAKRWRSARRAGVGSSTPAIPFADRPARRYGTPRRIAVRHQNQPMAVEDRREFTRILKYASSRDHRYGWMSPLVPGASEFDSNQGFAGNPQGACGRDRDVLKPLPATGVPPDGHHAAVLPVAQNARHHCAGHSS